jgi:hypothetical protein
MDDTHLPAPNTFESALAEAAFLALRGNLVNVRGGLSRLPYERFVAVFWRGEGSVGFGA